MSSRDQARNSPLPGPGTGNGAHKVQKRATTDIAAPAQQKRAQVSRWLVPLLLLAACCGFVGYQVSLHNHTSPVDEYVYIDYLSKVPEQLVVSKGESTGDFARNYVVCHGVSTAIDPQPALCNSGDISSEDVPFGGKSTADIYLPTYFATTWLTAQPISAILGTDLVTSARLVGGLWLSSAALLLFACLRRLEMAPIFSGLLPLFIVASLPAWWSTTYITTDATALFSGALVAFLLIRYLQTRRHGWTLIGASLLVVSLKLQNFAGVGAAILALLIVHLIEVRAAHQSGIRPRVRDVVFGRLPRLAGCMAIAPMLMELIWIALRPAVDGGESVDLQIEQPLGKTAFLQETLKFVGSLTVGARDPSLFNIVGLVLVSIFGLLLTAGLLGNTVAPANLLARIVSIATLCMLLLLGPALAMATMLAEGYYFPLPTRYGLSLLPFAFIAMVLFFSQNRIWTWVLSGLALALFLSTFWLTYVAN